LLVEILEPTTMLFNEILESEILKSPFIQTNRLGFLGYVNSKLDDYLELLNDLDPDDLAIKGLKTSKSRLVINQTEFVDGLKESIKLYYEGHPESAFNTLKETLEKRINKLKSLFSIETYDKGMDFYRIRVLNDNNKLNPENFFHIPFENRGKVTSQRFSIPGFPSLYLGQTIYICWEELNRPNINEFHAIRFQSTSPIKYINLAPPFFDNNLYQVKYYKYLVSWPLMFLCSIKVKNKNDIFKPEYIIPQLLLQWIRDNKDIDGVKYWSTHVDKDPTIFKGDFFNMILPVKKNMDSGLCESLTKKFVSTEVISWQLLEFATGGGEMWETSNECQKIDNKIEYLELIKGARYPYSYSAFGKMELFLDLQKLQKIKRIS